MYMYLGTIIHVYVRLGPARHPQLLIEIPASYRCPMR